MCDLGVLTSSRDKTIKLWAEEGKCYSLLHTLVRSLAAANGLRPLLPLLHAC